MKWLLLILVGLASAGLLDSAKEAVKKAFENAVKVAVEKQIKDHTIGKLTGTQSDESFLESVMAALSESFPTALKSEVKSVMCNFAQCPEYVTCEACFDEPTGCCNWYSDVNRCCHEGETECVGTKGPAASCGAVSEIMAAPWMLIMGVITTSSLFAWWP